MFKECIFCSVLVFSSVVAENRAQRTTPTEDYIPCERGWFLFNDKCYKLGGKKRSGRVTWERASLRCSDDGGTLATVYNQELNDFLTTFMVLDAETGAWIGLHDQANESIYAWQDGSPYEFNYWEPSEPSGPENDKEDCVEMVFGSLRPMGKTGQWNDIPCDYYRGFICQKPKTKQTKKTPDPRFCVGSVGAWKYRDSCYSLVSQKMSWENAEDHCRDKFRGHLVMIADFTVDMFLDYILSNFNKDVWIGIRVKEQLQQKWSSGWFVAYSDWSKDIGDFVDGTCALRSKSRLWTTSRCSRKYSFVCERSNVLPPVLPPPSKEAQCPDLPEDWRDLAGDYCYFFDTTSSVTWYEANFECMRRGGFLVSIHSETENAVLQPFIKHTQIKLFIGLYRMFALENVFVWADGTHLDFTNWNIDTDEPNNEYEKCGELWTSTMTWNDVKCDENKGYICSVRKLSSNITEIKAKTKCKTGIPVQAVIGMGTCMLLQAILIVFLTYRLRVCCRRQLKRSDTEERPPVPTTQRPRYYASGNNRTKYEGEYYEDMT